MHGRRRSMEERNVKTLRFFYIQMVHDSMSITIPLNRDILLYSLLLLCWARSRCLGNAHVNGFHGKKKR